ncbi:mitochondrial peripheral inner membrane protein [Metarhizium rileyi]|uniref:Mitochondrial peripheral inner membrane protein n=1 Tax=Metarhizium rileyi (strain RCEF 4871) TaxID=1649241 RepID=A0A5C6G2T2_METRR|nr:mitochondrial peripheral inner membrane protein [Metarhizium rileyi]
MTAPFRNILQASRGWTRKHIKTPRQGNHTAHTNKLARAFPPVLIAVGVIGTATYYALAPTRYKALNSDTFTPYTITSREPISPTSVIFTISPQQHGPSLPYLLPGSTAWRYPLWSVEFKQPEVQIARHYTPLPPADGDKTQDGTLSFYIRAVGGGEMSNYLNRQGVGCHVHLRGPHTGLDILGRLGGRNKVVFLAGGTGVVPGMQVAKAVLERDATSTVKLLWAVRRREELQRRRDDGGKRPWWDFGGNAAPTELTADVEEPSAMGKRLARMKATYGERLVILVAVDEERTRFTEGDLRHVLRADGRAPPGLGCRLHDQRLHTRASEFEAPGTACQCSPADDPGKNLLVVSGPEGFIAHYAGDKMWLDGTLTQGSVGGVAGELQRKDPSLANDWLVLKL